MWFWIRQILRTAQDTRNVLRKPVLRRPRDGDSNAVSWTACRHVELWCDPVRHVSRFSAFPRRGHATSISANRWSQIRTSTKHLSRSRRSHQATFMQNTIGAHYCTRLPRPSLACWACDWAIPEPLSLLRKDYCIRRSAGWWKTAAGGYKDQQ